MGSFVPLGGFFSSPDVKGSFSSSCSFRELPSVLNRGCTNSVADEQQTALPSWMQIQECGTNNMLDNLKVRIVFSNLCLGIISDLKQILPMYVHIFTVLLLCHKKHNDVGNMEKL